MVRFVWACSVSARRPREQLEVLTGNATEISGRAGRSIQVTHACARNEARAKERLAGRATYVADPNADRDASDIDIVVELIGGEQQALELVMAAIEHGKHVVTANKALPGAAWQ